jgi:hypothetical protein
MVTLYVFPPPLLGTPFGVQSADVLQFPVPPFQEEFVWPIASLGDRHATIAAAKKRIPLDILSEFMPGKSWVRMRSPFFVNS